MSPVVVPVSPEAGFCGWVGDGVGVAELPKSKPKPDPVVFWSNPHTADAEDAKIPSSITHRVNVNMLFVSFVLLILVYPFIIMVV
jgi:hypothetical protein